MSQESDLVCVRWCQGMLPAEIYRSKLEAFGIPVLLTYESAGPVLGITIDGLGEVRVLVPAQFSEEAEQVLRDLPEPTGASASSSEETLDGDTGLD